MGRMMSDEWAVPLCADPEFPDLERKFPDTPIKFPVPILSEFVANALVSRRVPTLFSMKTALFRENSLFIPCLTGNLGLNSCGMGARSSYWHPYRKYVCMQAGKQVSPPYGFWERPGFGKRDR